MATTASRPAPAFPPAASAFPPGVPSFPHGASTSGPVASLLRGPLEAWHLLSLDAPSVAVAWTLLLARVEHVALPPVVPVALALAVWALYAADRLLDSRSHVGPQEARHLFHGRHARAFSAGLVLAAAMLVPLLGRLPRAQLHLDLLLGAALLLWFGLVHLWQHLRRLRPLPKELVVGLFFGAAVSVPELAAPHAAPLLPGLGFAVLAALNCLWIAVWEQGPAHPAPVPRAVLQVASAALVSLPLLSRQPFLPVPVALALALAALLLLLLDRAQAAMPCTTLRAAADLALLTPLLLLPFAR